MNNKKYKWSLRFKSDILLHWILSIYCFCTIWQMKPRQFFHFSLNEPQIKKSQFVSMTIALLHLTYTYCFIYLFSILKLKIFELFLDCVLGLTVKHGYNEHHLLRYSAYSFGFEWNIFSIINKDYDEITHKTN